MFDPRSCLLTTHCAQGHRTILFGVPDCGKVCSEQHVPSYAAAAGALRAAGVTQVLCVAVGDPASASSWAKGLGLDPAAVTVAADTRGALTRFMGMELGAPDAPGPRSQRYAALIDDGLLLKIVSRGWGGLLCWRCSASCVCVCGRALEPPPDPASPSLPPLPAPCPEH